MPLVEGWCPTGDSKIRLGDGPVCGSSLTSGGGNVFTYSSADTAIQATGTLWLQSDGDGGLVCDSGVKIGTPAGLVATAGQIIKIWAGAGMSPSVGDAGGPGDPPAAPTTPCANTVDNVNRANALNGAIKGAADVVTGIADARNAENLADAARSGWDAAKGGWDVLKSANDAAGSQHSFLSDNVTNFVDGAIGLVDTGITMGNGDVPNVIGALNAGGKLLGAVSGDQGSEGASGGATEGAGGEGGAGEIDARAPDGIKKITDANMEAFVGKKIEYKAGTNIGMNAQNKIETCSMVFEAYANISATMKGLARAKVESVGSATLEGRAKTKVASNALIEVESGGAMKVDVTGLLKTKSDVIMQESAATTILSAGSSMLLDASATFEVSAPTIKIDGTTEITKATTIKDKLVVHGNVTAKDRLMVKGPGTFYKTLKVSGDLVGRGGVRLG